MKLLIITQNEPFYLKKNLNFFIQSIELKHDLVACVLTPPSPFGKKESFIVKLTNTFKIFGACFFLYYSFQYVKSLLFNNSVKSILKKNDIPIIKLEGQ